MIHVSNARDTLEKEMATHSICLENSRDGGVWWAAVQGLAVRQDLATEHTVLTLCHMDIK